MLKSMESSDADGKATYYVESRSENRKKQKGFYGEKKLSSDRELAEIIENAQNEV